jgi:hypothetical protein
VLLSDDLGELLRTVFAGQDGVTHAEETIIRDGRGGEGIQNQKLSPPRTLRTQRNAGLANPGGTR